VQKLKGLKLPVFPIKSQHVPPRFSTENPPLPKDFHSYLCTSIRRAEKRICLASLYVGPAASKTAVEEHELLNALSEAPRDVPIQILLDANRGTRPIKLKQIEGDSKSETTSSAKAVCQALSKRNDSTSDCSSSLHLFPTLPPLKQLILPSPLNEAAAVFHMKVYIVDDELILSGANLSGEYFRDRQDRYFHLVQGGGGLVDWYAQLIEILCAHSNHFEELSTLEEATRSSTDEEQKALLERLNDHMSTPAPLEWDEKRENEVLAWAVPTLQIPKVSLPFANDWTVTEQILECAASEHDSSVRLASAYLNPTPSMLKSLGNIPHFDLLTAGPKSHGFAPKPGVKRKGDFVPHIFMEIARELRQKLSSGGRLHWYERDGWTFHAKGLWVMQGETTLVAAMVGSGNYGYRSYVRDVESNVLLVFPKTSSELQSMLSEEWNNMTSEHTDHSPKDLNTSLAIRATLLVTRSFY